MEREKADQDEQGQHGQRVGDRLGVRDGAGHGRRDPPTLEEHEPEEPRQRRGDVDPHAEGDQGDQHHHAADADPELVRAGHREASD